jgi:GPH family glycoside/pentoside/hexuronide:cation symporter
VPPFDLTGKVIYYIAASFIFDVAYTIVNVPYGALNTEMTEDYHERTSLNAFRFSFSILGNLAALILHTTITGSVKPASQGYAMAALVLGVLVFVPYLFAFWKTYERPNTTASEAAEMPLLRGLRLCLANKPFILLVGIYLSAWLAVQTAQTMFAYYLSYWLKIKDQLPVLFAVQISSFLGLIVWSRVAKRMGKKNTFVIGALLWMAVMAVLYVLPRDVPGAVVTLVSACAGLTLSIAYLIPWAMLPDVITHDEIATGARREGIFYGYFALLQKLGAALASWLIGIALELSGYISPPPGTEAVSFEQSAAALSAIRMLIGIAPIAALVFGVLLARQFPIDQKRHEANLAEIERRRALTTA